MPIIIVAVIALVVLTVIDLVLLELRQAFFTLCKERKWSKELDAEIENIGPDFDEDAVCEDAVCEDCGRCLFSSNPHDFANTCSCWLPSPEELEKLLNEDEDD
jgi:hypothetical protein